MIEPTAFELVEDGDISTYKREVKTPMPASEDGSGYKTEENFMWAYNVGPHWLKVSKVSNRGWSIWHYKEGDDGLSIEGHYTSEGNAQEAQRTARRKLLALGSQR